MADQADPLAGPDRQREVAVERRRVAAIVEGDVLEVDPPAVDADRPWRRRVGDAERLAVDLDQFLHVVHRALQVADVHADVAQIALQHEEGGEHVGDVAGASRARATRAAARCR